MATMKESLENVIDKKIERERKGYHNPLEAFEYYKNRKKAQYIKLFDDYAKATQRGYNVIIEEIKRNNQE